MSEKDKTDWAKRLQNKYGIPAPEAPEEDAREADEEEEALRTAVAMFG